ncbi:aliphatic sulfonate ABC transporter substrate-binding protein [Pseudoclavibacter soli]|uniref:aliphatic sulfonate ABC transporter substrate-binding protein n=1 Tax=Pseudoclavibacter soli TaxID=452623 RepID=UPI0003FF1E25|nr:aliphatic sulfonate ABC transporter substrate-binding protein [Pseudoclavibacter soli]
MITKASRRPRRLAIASTVLIAAVAASLVGCSSSDSSSSSADSDTISIATQPWLGYGPWYIAEENGYFEDQGVDAKITSFDDDSQMTAALGSGEVDIANAASHTALQWLENGQEGYIALLLDTSLTADAVLAGPNVNSISDLKGKKVAYEEGSVSNLLLDHALSANGMSIDDIESVPMDPSDAAVALASGRVDAAVTYEPYITDSLAQDSSIKKLYTADEQEGLISDVLFVSKKALEEKPEAVRKAIQAWGPAVDFYNSNTDEAQEIIAKNVGSSAEDLKTAFDGVKFFSLDDNKTELGGDYLTNVLPSVQESALSAGILTEKLDLNDVVDTQFVK